MPAREFDYTQLEEQTSTRKQNARKQQLKDNKNTLYKTTKNLLFQTDNIDIWMDVLLNFKPQDLEKSCNATARVEDNGRVVVYGTREDLNVFEEEFDQMLLEVEMRNISLQDAPQPQAQNQPAEGPRDAPDDDDAGITVIRMHSLKYRGAKGRALLYAVRNHNAEL
ncbi:hypothetical protein NQD34_014488 [Periophthalmus magnuspinnatus]|nr:hypothetical protein NQD34_014488 [Periophthalmus magnuspinnatus]